MIKWARLVASSSVTVLHAHCTLKRYKKHSDKHPLNERIKKLHHYCKKLCDGGLRVRFIIKGEENIPEGQTLFIGNHCSLIDPVLFYALIDKPSTVVAKKEIRKMPFIGDIVKSVDGFFLDRGNPRKELKTFIDINKKLEANKDLSILIYPEGTRSKAPDFPLLPFHAGTFKVATRRGLPIVPICLCHSDRILNQRFHYHVYPIQVSILKPVTKEEYENMTGEELSSMLHQRMEEDIASMRENDAKLIQQWNHYSDKKMEKVFSYQK